jgi:glycosyltransferase involved in cell wall biosynthesis
MYKISLIIPIYNVSKYIEKSLLSALNQSFESIEYILIDDCGTDNSMILVDEILKNHPRRNDVFIHRHEKNLGLSAARNSGINLATGEYIFFMDSDDEITSDCLEVHYNAITKNNADFTSANFEFEGINKTVHASTIKQFEIKVNDNIIKSFFKREWNVSATNKLYKKAFLRSHNIEFTSNLLHEDILWMYLISLNALKVALIPVNSYIYKIRKNSITTSKNSSVKIESLIFIIEYIFNDFTKKKELKSLNKDMINYLSFLRFNTALLLINNSDTLNNRKKYYKVIKSRKYNNNNHTFYTTLLTLPFLLFVAIFKLPYYLYKKNN